MRVDTNITFMARPMQESGQDGKEKDGRAAGKSGNQTVFAGDMQGDFSLQGRIRQKRERAQKRAMKVVNDAWNGDRKIEDEINASKERIKAYREEKKELGAEIHRVQDEMDGLREKYGVETDSKEERDLQFLKRVQERSLPGGEPLSDEEKERVEELREKGLTEYQDRVMELNRSLLSLRAVFVAGDKRIEEENDLIRKIREERRKVHPMLDAREQAEEILDAAEEEITGMVVDDAKEHLDEESEKREEQAEEIREEKEKQEEILEKREERQEVLEELMEELPVDKMVDMEQTLAEVKRQIQNILNEMTLVTEDIKGSQVDASV